MFMVAALLVPIAEGTTLRKAWLKQHPEAAGGVKQNPICLTNTGLKCGGCKEWSECASDGKSCMCPHWGCSDHAGNCRPIWSHWLEVEHRIAPARKANWFMAMEPKNQSNPLLQQTWPGDDMPTGIWLFLVQNDNTTVLIATKQGRYLTDLHFLDLPNPPWDQKKLIAPIQRTLDRAGQAEWQIEQAGMGQKRFLHVASGRYLSVDNFRKTVVNRKITPLPKEQVPVLSSCAPENCPEFSTEFQVWPQTEHPLAP